MPPDGLRAIPRGQPGKDLAWWCNGRVSEPALAETRSKVKKSRVTELIVLVESSVLAVWSLTWLGVATVQSHVERVRWELWVPSRATGDTVYDNYLSTSAAVWISCGTMVVVVALATLGYLTALRSDRGPFGVTVATRIAALSMLPLTVTLPVQFAAFQQTQGWVGDNHGLELIVKYGAFAGFLVGIGLLMGTKEFVDPS